MCTRSPNDFNRRSTRSQVLQRTQDSNTTSQSKRHDEDKSIKLVEELKTYIEKKIEELFKDNKKMLNDLVSSINIKMDEKIANIRDEMNKVIQENNLVIKHEINKIKQKALVDEIEIFGITKQTDEDISDLKSTITGLANEINVNMEPSDIKNIYRKNNPVNNGLPGSIVVKLSSIQLAKGLVSGSRKHKPKRERNVYINNHLTSQNKYLEKRARDLRRKGIISKFRLQNEQIQAINAEGNIITINEQFLSNLNQNPNPNVKVMNGINFNSNFSNDITLT